MIKPATIKIIIGLLISLIALLFNFSMPYGEDIQLLIVAFGAVFFVKGVTELGQPNKSISKK